jgi:pimeloyl-ACP methyl ester carboxylesterase
LSKIIESGFGILPMTSYLRTSKMKPKDKYVDLNGLRAHYLDWGRDGLQPMLLLHGFMAHAHAWDDFASAFKARYHVIALDQRGHGESQWCEDGAYSLSEHFSDLVYFVEGLDLKGLILVGHSMGGRNALFYTACNPQRVKKLVLVDARPASDPKSSRALRRDLRSLPYEALSLSEVVRTIQDLYPYLSRKTCRHLACYGYRQIAGEKFVPRFDLRMSLELDRLGCVTENLWPFLKNVACPTLIIRGKESPFLSRADARKMCGMIQSAKMMEIPLAAHMPVQENPRSFRKVISEFLDDKNK